MNLIKTLEKIKLCSRIFFTTPLHSQGEVIPGNLKKLLGKKVFQADFSEVDGLDNVRNPQSVILSSLKETAKIYGAKHAFYLFNGASSGIVASILASVKEKEQIVIARNCHVSVYNALVLSGATPVWLDVEYDEEFNLPNQISAVKIKEKLDEFPEIKAVVLTSPTYEGVCSDIKAISKVCKQKNVVLIVDEAHGSLFSFSDKLPENAIKQGADVCVDSLHKGLCALTQCGVLLLSANSKVQFAKIQETLNLICSTSPSYPLLASIEGSVEFADSKDGQKKISKLLKNIEKFKTKLQKFANIKIAETSDLTKLFVKIDGYSGHELSEILNSYNIEDEMVNDKGVLCLTGIGTSSEKLKILRRVLAKIAKTIQSSKVAENKAVQYISPKVELTPKEAFNSDFEIVGVKNSVGKVSKELVIPYPPGIPVLIPGEIIQEEHLKYFEQDKIKICK